MTLFRWHFFKLNLDLICSEKENRMEEFRNEKCKRVYGLWSVIEQMQKKWLGKIDFIDSIFFIHCSRLSLSNIAFSTKIIHYFSLSFFLSFNARTLLS